MKRENIGQSTDCVAASKKARKENDDYVEESAENLSSQQTHVSEQDNKSLRSVSANQILQQNIADLVSKVKQEANEHDIQTYAQHAMNELLGLYGYEKVAASDIGKFQHHSVGGSAENDSRNREATKSTSPNSVQSNPAHLLSHSDDEDATCSWCSATCHAVLSLQESGCTKSFCSEKCFASCRRANFKRNKGNLNSINEEEKNSLPEKISFFKPKTTQNHSENSREIRSKPSSLGAIHSATPFEKQQKSSLNNNEKSKTAPFKKKEKQANIEKNKRFPHGDQQMELLQNQYLPDEALLHKKGSPTKQISHNNQEVTRSKLNSNSFAGRQTMSSDLNFEQLPRKLSSEFKHQQVSETLQNNSDPLLSANFSKQLPFLGLYPYSTFPFLGMPNLASTMLDNSKIDLESFRLGILTALQQNKSSDFVPESALFSNNTSPEAISTPTVSYSHISQGDYNQANLPSSTKQPMQTESKMSPNITLKIPHCPAEEKKHQSFQTNNHLLPPPFLMVPFPIPIPVPIPIPALLPNREELQQPRTETSDCGPQSVYLEQLNHENTVSSNTSRKNSRDESAYPVDSCSSLDHDETLPEICAAIDLSMRAQQMVNNHQQDTDSNESKITSST